MENFPVTSANLDGSWESTELADGMWFAEPTALECPDM